MKRSILSLGFLFFLINISSQDYMITFVVFGYDGPPDSIQVYNRDQKTTSVLSGEDILHLVKNITGISDIDLSQNPFDVYPNPFDGRATVELYNPHDGLIYILISDLSGRTIVAQKVNMHQGYISFDISGLSKGTYLLKVQGKDIEQSALLISTGADFQTPALNIAVSTGSEAPSSIQTDLMVNDHSKSAKSTEEIHQMRYDDGDQLVLTGYLLMNRAEVVLVPISSQEVGFEFSPDAGFLASIDSCSTGTLIQFTDTSTNNPMNWIWDFGDDGGSLDQHPVHSYSTPGKYTVWVIAGNEYGSDTETRVEYITVYTSVPVAEFNATPVEHIIGESVQFTDQSWNEPATWEWDFGDGQSSTESDPAHSYAATGSYTVSLTVSNTAGTDIETKTDYITVNPLAPVAEFVAMPVDLSTGESVQFTDLSLNEPATWEWNFGDGQSSAESDPSHSYTSSGIYMVSLTVSNATGTDIETKTNYITVIPLVPVAEFSATPIDPLTGESVQFTDQSLNEPSSWEWDFGDGQSSTESDPTHSYASTGSYTVSLTVSNVTGTDVETKTNHITVRPLVPVAEFTASPVDLTEGESVQFTDLSSNEVISWDWDFGDGQSSTASDPLHTYFTAGTYTVSLTVSNPTGTDTETKNGLITVNPEISGTISDIDGNSYNTIVIGAQDWMAENLRTTRYADGAAIPYVDDATSWEALDVTDPAYCWYGNNPANGVTYGAMYNWPAAMRGAVSTDANPSGVQGVCPSGWHLPSDSELRELEIHLGMSASAAVDFDFRGTDEGGKLKETGTVHWNSPNTGATNESGFTALAGGFRRPTAEFYGIGIFADIWTTTDDGGTEALRRYLPYNEARVFRNYLDKNFGFSVRCVKD